MSTTLVPATTPALAPAMTAWAALARREWLQHRRGWSLIVGVPLALALLAAAFAQFRIDAELPARPDQLQAVTAFASIAGATVVLLIVAAVTSLIFMAGLPRRDHGDRSVEFWLSLPVGHAASLGVPLVVHLLLVPAAAVLIGFAAGQLLCLVIVGRLGGVAAWAGLPWSELLAATVALVVRLLAGLPLAVLWILPLVLVLALMNAWFKRWGWVVLVVGVGVLGLAGQFSVGQRWILDTAGAWVRQAGLALVGAGGRGLSIRQGEDGIAALGGMPGLAWQDFVAALAVSAAAFWALVRWRARGAGLWD